MRSADPDALPYLRSDESCKDTWMSTGPGTDDIGHLGAGAVDPNAQVAPVELTMVTMILDASDPAALAALLSRYVVTTRRRPGCRNVDLCASLGVADRFVVVEKWDSPQAQAEHFSSPEVDAFAGALGKVLRADPQFDLLASISAHDLA
jgi:quinol monooxygenase YgiN